MRKIFVILSLILLFCPLCHTAQAEEKCVYAKITSSNAYIFTTTSESSTLFVLPYSYFVKVDAVSGEFYHVTYKDISGYVKKDSVTLMNGEPNTPYLNATFTTYVDYYLYSSPSALSSAITPITQGETLAYYGTMDGQEVSSWGNTWYYACYTLSGLTYYGYVYFNVTSNLSAITENTETFETLTEDWFSSQNETSFADLSTGTKVLLIVAVTVPSALILFFLIKPTRSVKTQTKTTTKRRKIQHGDYFEFDETQL